MLAKIALVGCVLAAVPVLVPVCIEVYQTGFEDPQEVQPGLGTLEHWGMFEEIVDPLYYATGLGSVERSDDFSSEGGHSLLVWPNAAQSLVNGQGKSNHIIAQRKLQSEGVTGRWRYEFDFYVPVTTDPTQVGHTGPEWSVQSTREVSPGVWRTHTVGLQYIANPNAGSFTHKWQIWTESEPSSTTARWRVDLLPELNATLHVIEPGQWYAMEMEVDFTANRYVSVHIAGSNFDESIDLSDIVIVPEVKFTQSALWISCEAENQWVGNQPFVRHYKIYYDRLRLSVVVDTDLDGLSDEDETSVYFTDPHNPDTDGDGLMDGTEVALQAESGVPGCPDPLQADSDGDLIPDGVEVDSDPSTNPCSADSDEDGLTDLIDPDPNTPVGQNPAGLAAAVRFLADQFDALPLSVFDAPNNNAAAGRRNSMASRIRGAANKIASSQHGSARSRLTAVLEKMDGAGKDWLYPSPTTTALANSIVSLIAIL